MIQQETRLTGLSQISFHDYFLLYITISQRLPAQ